MPCPCIILQSSRRPSFPSPLKRTFWWLMSDSLWQQAPHACSVRNPPPRVTPLHGFYYWVPQSDGLTPIMLVADRFSKAAHIVLSKLPSACETVQLVIQHVFRLLELLQDIASNQNLQFTFRFWKAFCSLRCPHQPVAWLPS